MKKYSGVIFWTMFFLALAWGLDYVIDQGKESQRITVNNVGWGIAKDSPLK